MRRLATALLLLGLLAGCGAQAGTSGGSSASCAAVVRWNGTRYLGTQVRGDRLERAGRLGRGFEPGCSDTAVNGRPADPGPGRRLTVWRIRDVPPRLAVMVAEMPHIAYISPRCVRVHRCRKLLHG